MVKKKRIIIFLMLIASLSSAFAADRVKKWQKEWPRTDFRKTSIDFKEISEGGPQKDGIPSINRPKFKPVWEVGNLGRKEPVISLNIKGDMRAYPLRIMMYHEIVNDVVGGIPVAITYCPLCNAALVFERVIDGRPLSFGTTGKLRNSDLVMYDRQSESWWQQFTGEAIVGRFTGRMLKAVPSRIESFSLFKERYPRGQVLIPTVKSRRYGKNPYVKYDTKKWPFLYDGDYDGDIPPMARLVAVGVEAWPLSLIRKKKIIRHNGLLITWQAGQNSALDRRKIKQGRDIGNVTVTREGVDVVYHIPFAFAFKAFHPAGFIYSDQDDSGK